MAVSLSISVKQNSQNVANKTSNVTVNVVASWTYGSWNATGECYGYLTIDGTKSTHTKLTFNSGRTTTGSEVIMSETLNVNHNNDGTKTVNCSAEFFTGLSPSVVKATASKTLTTIYQVSTPTLSSSSVDMGAPVTISTNRYSTSYTHDLAYSFAGGAYTTIATGVTDSYKWFTPDLASKIPNTTSGTVTIRCITKKGSTIIGGNTVTMTLKVPASVVPTISSVAVTEATDGLAKQFGAFIQGKSALNVAITAAGAKGSTISSYKTTLPGVVYTDASFTTNVLTADGTFKLVTTVTDSRGRTASKTVDITVLSYMLPSTSEFIAKRCNQDGDVQDDGTYLSVSYAYRVASCGGKNTAVMVIEYKTSASSAWQPLATGTDLEGSGIRFFYNGPTFSLDYQYDIRMTVTDWFGASTSYTVVLSSADVVLDISSDGTGLGLGKVSQKTDAIELGRKLYDMVGGLIGNGLAAYSGSGSGAIDPDTTLEHLCVTDKNTPTTGFWYVLTLFYSSKSVTSNRAQLALPYNTVGSLWTRRSVGEVWSAWQEVPAVAESGTSGIWSYVKWSDGRVEMSGIYYVLDLPCTTAIGNWFRTAVLKPDAFPFTVYGPELHASYESDGYGAVLWATTTTGTKNPANYYLIRPTSTTINGGKIIMRVTGRWK